MMNHTALHKTQNHNPACNDFMMMAEQELNAFFTAVKDLFGSEQAKISAEYWLHELEVINHLPTSTSEWRQLTTNATSRLAAKVTHSSPVLA